MEKELEEHDKEYPKFVDDETTLNQSCVPKSDANAIPSTSIEPQRTFEH